MSLPPSPKALCTLWPRIFLSNLFVCECVGDVHSPRHTRAGLRTTLMELVLSFHLYLDSGDLDKAARFAP